MFLLIPATIKKIRNEERQEGRQEGLEAALQRAKQAFELFGVEIDGVLMLPPTPEVAAFLNGDGNQE